MTDHSTVSVSVVIAAFNAVPFVSRAISSALDQESVSLEVIVIDDASTDATSEFVRREFPLEGRLKVLRLPDNLGPSGARNLALKEAKGTWIAILDADDAFSPRHLSELVNLAEHERADIAAGNFLFFDAERQEPVCAGLNERSGIDLLDRYAFLSGARPYRDEADFGLLKPVFRTQFLRSHNLQYPADVRHGEDMELVLNALIQGAKYVVKRSLLSYLYTTRSSGNSRTVVNYSAQVRRTLSFRERADIRSDRRLKRLLTERATALQQLELDRNWTMRSVSRWKTAGHALRSSLGAKWLLKRAAKKLVRR